MAKSRLEISREERLQKLEKIKSLGINPFPAKSNKSNPNADFLNNFDSLKGSIVTASGRLMSFRGHGQIAFADVQDSSAKIQLYIRQDIIKPLDLSKQTLGFQELKLIDPGDFVEATGELTKTQTGQVSILVHELKLLTKSIRPMPSNQDIISDPETIFRRRYLDLMLNQKSRELFVRKSKFWQCQRQFMFDHGFIEVETPVLEHVTGGADARPFITHMNSLDQDFFLRISTELYQKRLIGGGFEKIFTLAPNFRNEGLSEEHLNEYYQLEWYWAYADYRDNMTLVTDLFRHIAKEVYGSTKFTRGQHTFDLADEWTEISYPDVIKEKLQIDISSSSDEEMLSCLKSKGVKLTGVINRNRLIDNLWKVIRKDISGPAFLINEPKFMSPLAKSKQDDPETTERFHIIIAGSELGNGYSELNDPLDQLARFQDQQNARDAGDHEAQMMDIDFVEMLEYGMPPTSGYGHSERVFWYFENITAREGTLFPALRHKIDPLTQKIYQLKPLQQSINVSEKEGIAPDVKKTFPGIFFAQLTINNVKVEKSNPDLGKHKQKILSHFSKSIEDISDIVSIQSYRKLLKSTGTDWHSKRPSPEALLRRIAQGKGLYCINTAVDAYNIAVIETGIGLGGFDAKFLSLPVMLRFSKAHEEMLLLGDDKITQTRDGQLVYSDQKHPITIDLNYRDIDETKITTKTQDIILFADGAPGISQQDVISALQKGAKYITQYSGGQIGETTVFS